MGNLGQDLSKVLNNRPVGIGEGGGLPAVPATGSPADVLINPDLEVTAMKPTKRNLLGKIADSVLLAYGKPPIYESRMRERDLQNAMEGFTQDPLNTIRRIGQIPGYAEEALKLFNQQQDNARADVATESLAESRKAKLFPRIGGLLRAIQKAQDPNSAYKNNLSRLRRLQEMAGDTETLPDEYNPEAIEQYIGLTIDPEDQIRMEALEQYRADKLDLDERKFRSQDSYRQERLEDFDNAESGRNERANNRPNNRRGSSGGPAGVRVVRDPQGNVVGVLDKTGKVAKVKAPDGGHQYFEVLPNGRLGKRIPNELVKEKGK